MFIRTQPIGQYYWQQNADAALMQSQRLDIVGSRILRSSTIESESHDGTKFALDVLGYDEPMKLVMFQLR